MFFTEDSEPLTFGIIFAKTTTVPAESRNQVRGVRKKANLGVRAVMNTVTSTFQWEREGETLILTPQADLHELDYQEIEAEEQEILAFLDSTPVRNVVVDFRKTDFFGSSALGFFLKLWRKVRESGGHMAFCNVSDHEQELFRLTRLDRLWPVWPTCEEAMAAVRR